MDNSLDITITQAKDLVIDCLKIKRIPMLISSPGMGKSAMIHEVAREFNLFLIDVRGSSLQPVDANGLPGYNEDKTKAKFVPMDMFPLENDPIPEGYSGFLIFFDELNSTHKSVIPALYKVVLDRKIGQDKIHPKALMAAAGNRMTDNAIVNPMGTAMDSRVIHLFAKSDYKGWLENVAYPKEYDHRVTSFINYKPTLINNFKPDTKDHTFACERTWEVMSDLLKIWGENISQSKLPLFTGNIGTAAGREFYSFCRIYKDLPSMQSILADPENAQIPSGAMNQWAIAGAVGHNLNKNNAEQLALYMNRLPFQFQTIVCQQAIAKDTSLLGLDCIKAWVSKTAKVIG